MTCALCRQPPTKENPLHRHHVRGRKKGADNTGLVMKVHAFACHPFADFVTQYFKQRGKLDSLQPHHITYLYSRTVSLRDGHKLVFEEPL